LSNNTAYNGGAVWSNTLNGCWLMVNLATNNGGAIFYANATNCTLSGNRAGTNGGGAYGGYLNGCLVTNNSAYNSGGGIASNTSISCLIISNAASGGGGAYSSKLMACIVWSNSASLGGGSYGSTMSRCVIAWNMGKLSGGGSAYDDLNNCITYCNSTTVGDAAGAYISVLNNCTVTGNFCGITTKSSTLNCKMTNSIIYYNHGGYDDISSVMDHCCVSRFSGINSFSSFFTDAPLFLDSAYHLQTNSPCIDAGNNNAVATLDFDGRPRVANGTVDVGATEFQGPSMEPFISWLYQYGLPNDGSVDFADSDGDGLNNWQEWKAGTSPTNAASVLQMASPSNTASGVIVTWQSVTNVTYYLQGSTNLAIQPAFTTLQSNLVGQVGTTSYTDTAATNGGTHFYRVGVQ
jgi:hypothetical protein